MYKKIMKSLKYCKSERNRFAGMITLRIILMTISVVQPLIYANMITRLLNKQLRELSMLIGFLFVTYFLSQLLGYLLKRMEARTSKNINFYVKQKVTEYLLKVPNYRMNISQGKMYSVLVSDSMAVYSVVSVMLSIIFTVLSVVGIGLVTVCINWQLCVLLIIPYPAILFINCRFRKVIKKNAVDLMNQNDEYLNHVKNMIGNIGDIKNQNGSRRILRKVCGEAAKGRDLSIRQMMSQTDFDGLVSAAGMLGHIVLTAAGVYFVYTGMILFGTFVAFNNYSRSLSSSIDALVNVRTNLQPLMVSLERLLELEQLSRESDPGEEPEGITAEGIRSICFRNVSLSYGENEILHQVSFQLHRGKITGFIGKNGSGKTSIMKLIMQDILQTGGEILMNGISAEKYAYFPLRKQFEYIGVNKNLYYLSIYDNIALSDDVFLTKKKEEEIRQTCDEVGLLQDINELPDTFHTQIGDENMFSTGQVKKLQIARAFIKDGSVLIFDEALSNLDDATRRSLAVKLRKLAEDKIIILISHNREDYRICDEVYQIEGGHLEKLSVPSELLQEN